MSAIKERLRSELVRKSKLVGNHSESRFHKFNNLRSSKNCHFHSKELWQFNFKRVSQSSIDWPANDHVPSRILQKCETFDLWLILRKISLQEYKKNFNARQWKQVKDICVEWDPLYFDEDYQAKF